MLELIHRWTQHSGLKITDSRSPVMMTSQIWFALAKSLFHKQRVYYQNIKNNYTAELSFASASNTLSRRAQMSTEICTKLFTRRRIKRRDRRRSFSISLNFYQTILESSPQTRFMFDIKKLLNRCANIYSRRNTGRPVENCDRFARRIPKAGHITDYSKAESTGVEYDPQRCVTPQLSFLLFHFVTFHYDMKLIYCGVLLLRKF